MSLTATTANPYLTPVTYLHVKTIGSVTTDGLVYSQPVPPPISPVAPKSDDPLSWLRQRVEEVLWDRKLW